MKDLSGFRFWLVERGRKPGTVRIAVSSLDRVQRSGYELNIDGASSYLFFLQEKGKKGSYLNILINSLRLYGQYTHDEQLSHLKWRKEVPYIKSTLSDEEIESFLSLPPPSITAWHAQSKKMVTYTTKKELYHTWTVFFSIMAYSGMRPGEIAHLTIDTVDFGRNLFILEDTKTNEPRFVPISANILTLLHDHIATVKGKYLFPARRKNGDPVVCNTDWFMQFRNRINRLGIKRKNLTPYSLRHSFITRLLEEDVNIFKVQKIVGHKQITTTAGYTHLTQKDMQEAIKKHPLIRRSTDPKSILKAVSDTIKGFQLEKDPRFRYEIIETEDSFEVRIRLA